MRQSLPPCYSTNVIHMDRKVSKIGMAVFWRQHNVGTSVLLVQSIA